MTDSLNCIRMEKNAVLSADSADLADRLDSTDLVIGIHDCYEACIFADRFLDLLRKYDAVGMDIKERDLEALFFELLQSM